MCDLTGSKILLVDDYPLNNALLARALPEHKIAIATNGQDALDMVAMEMPDLILLDITMPGIDGYEVCRRLKQQPCTRDIPIIFLTGLDDSASITQGFQVGGIDYITKPIDIAAVQARVKNHLILKRSLEELKQQKALLEETVIQQHLDINLARNILKVVNSAPPRQIDLNQNTLLFIETLNKSCNIEGGDHLLVKHNPRANKTILSLKDQSGHSVNCVLRSIITDLLYNDLAFDKTNRSLDDIVTRLNQNICNSGLFQADEFCTAIMAEIDHQNLTLTYVTAGHPPILVLRDGEVISLPGEDQDLRNLPLGFMAEVGFTAGSFPLQHGDKLLIYSDGLHQVHTGSKYPPLSPQELIQEIRSLLADDPNIPVSLFIPSLLTHLCGSVAAMTALCEHNTTDDDLSLIALEVEAKTYRKTASHCSKEFADIDSLIAHLFKRISEDLAVSDFASITQKVSIVLSEAVINAWKHGNRKKTDQPITVKWRFANDFSIEVIDSGKGFNFHDLPNPTTGANLTATNGRGTFIIKKFADTMAWREEGRRLVLNWRHPLAIPITHQESEVCLEHDLWAEG
ncbi:MAG: response regulator [Proteobacteria bacterium]|nr:response regulator [Desulfobulbaceae bacterium]MBU4154251.1 response regulator [Pseudomonadota bacterium]